MNRQLNDAGFSILEVISSIFIISTIFLIIIQLFFFAAQTTKKESIATNLDNIANSTLSYIKKQDFNNMQSQLEEQAYIKLDSTSCDNNIFNNKTVCENNLNIIINNKTYDKENIQIYILKYNDSNALEKLKLLNISTEFNETIDNISFNDKNYLKDEVVYIIVVCSDKKDNVIYEGVITNENY